MSHKVIRRLSVVACLALCIGLLVLAFRSNESPDVAKVIKTPPPSASPVAASPVPEPAVVSPAPRMSPKSTPAAKPAHPGMAKAGTETLPDPATAKPDERLAVITALAELAKAGEKDLEARRSGRMLGITPSTLSEDEGRQLGLLADQGAIRVDAVIPDSVAATLGLQKGDIITTLDGVSLPRGREVETLRATMSGIDAKRPAALTIHRDGRSMILFPTWD